ncbi:SDR family oxidoreductase [Archangium violaceum]|uniref:SDR family oxidoreductase n=1 Tax=Archangium violaceum TaxID=83451 RepID=UPI0036DD04CF
MHLFLTGVTGAVGMEMARWIVRNTPKARVYALIRAPSPVVLKARWSKLAAKLWPEASARPPEGQFIPVLGDISQPGLGLSPEDAARLASEVTHVIHSAANVELDAPLPEARAANVDGTRHVFEVVRSFRRLERVGYVSTLFIAGKRPGRLLETDAVHASEFVNPYEQSKYEAEHLVRGLMKELPIAMYRLAYLIGRDDGEVTRYNSMHSLMRLFYQGHVGAFPGTPDSRMDLSSNDYAAAALLTLFLEHYQPGRTFHIGNGDEGLRLQDFIDTMTEVSAETERRWAQGVFLPPDVVDEDTYTLLRRTLLQTQNKQSHEVIRLGDTMYGHLLANQIFDAAPVHALLGERVKPPPAKQLLRDVLRHCVATDWGRNRI